MYIQELMNRFVALISFWYISAGLSKPTATPGEYNYYIQNVTVSK